MKKFWINIQRMMGKDVAALESSTGEISEITGTDMQEVHDHMASLTTQLTEATTAKTTAEGSLAALKGELSTAQTDLKAKTDELATATKRIEELEATGITSKTRVRVTGDKPAAVEGAEWMTEEVRSAGHNQMIDALYGS